MSSLVLSGGCAAVVDAGDYSIPLDASTFITDAPSGDVASIDAGGDVAPGDDGAPFRFDTGSDAAPLTDAGPADQDAATAACTLSYKDPACDACFQRECASECQACSGDPNCSGLYNCIVGCDANSSTCTSDCLSQYGFSASAALFAVISDDKSGCAGTKCGDVCRLTVGIGDVCSADTDCTSGSCAGGTGPASWCSQSCTSSTQCAGTGTNGRSNSVGSANVCVGSSGGGNFCFPSCTKNADCASFANATCVQTTTTERGSVSVCSSAN